ncbi:hypothetical protein D3C84_1025660 [compost metagenome]
MARAQILQAHADTQQPHRFAATGEGLAEQLLITAQITPGTGLLQGGLGKIVELHFDEGFARPVTVIDTRHASGQGLQQFRQFLQAAGQIG